jgi:hypothetical protein
MTPSGPDEVGLDQGEPKRCANDVPVRELLAAGAKRGLTTDQMFPGRAASGAPALEQSARSTP